MEVCAEMKKLRDWLDENNVGWFDKSDDFGANPLPDGRDYNPWMCRTKITDTEGKEVISVINGYGSYGGVQWLNGKNQGLLEAWGDKIGDGSPVGGMTADDVIKEITEHYCDIMNKA